MTASYREVHHAIDGLGWIDRQIEALKKALMKRSYSVAVKARGPYSTYQLVIHEGIAARSAIRKLNIKLSAHFKASKSVRKCGKCHQKERKNL
jgi:hypothetical protein